MTGVLIYLYEMLLFILPTLSLVWITYRISMLKAYSESLVKYVYYIFMVLCCISDMYIYGCFFRLKVLYNYGNNLVLSLSQTGFLVLHFIGIYYLQKDRIQKQNFNTAIIAEAVDEFPGGLSFSDKDGVPILVNKKMHRLIYELVNLPFIDANAIWQALSLKAEKNQFNPKLLKKEQGLYELYHKLKDGSIWRFKKSVISAQTEEYVQIEAIDISNLASIANEINEDNKELKNQNKRIKLVSLELEKVNRDKERYFAKVALHGEFGEYILWLRQFLKESKEGSICMSDFKQLETRWYKAKDIIKGIGMSSETAEIENELLKVGKLIGCNIFFPKEKPYKTYQALYYTAIREALTNAVRHAAADELYIKIEEKLNFQKVTIFDNGSKKINFVREGNGLSALRKLMEKEGVKLKLQTEGVFKLLITFPHK